MRNDCLSISKKITPSKDEIFGELVYNNTYGHLLDFPYSFNKIKEKHLLNNNKKQSLAFHCTPRHKSLWAGTIKWPFYLSHNKII